MINVVAGIILMFFGAAFAGIPTGVITFVSSHFRSEGISNVMFIPFIAIFIFIGITIFISGVKIILKHFKINRVKKHGTLTTATFVRMESNTSNNIVVKNYRIVLKYNDMNGIETIYKTKFIYKYEDANYYANIKTFKIRYIGKDVEIVEDIDYNKYEEINPNNNNTGLLGSLLNKLNTNLNPNSNKPKEYYYRCDYCGNIQDKAEKCKSCGAKIHPDSKILKH